MFSLLVKTQIFIAILLAGEVMGFLCRKEYQNMAILLIIKYHLNYSKLFISKGFKASKFLKYIIKNNFLLNLRYKKAAY